MKERIQAFSGAMMIPVILLVLVGLFVGVGAAFTNYLLEENTILWQLAKLIVDVGFMVMNYLPFFFAIGLAIGLAKQEKGWAGFSAFTMFMAFNVAIRSLADINGWNAATVAVDNLIANHGMSKEAAMNFNALWGDVGGVFTYNMGIFSGLICGVTTALIHNRFYRKTLPNAFSFFSGPRFVVIMVFVCVVPLAAVIYYIWPAIASGLQSITSLITESGLAGSFLFGAVDKALLPFGIHHLIAFPIEYTRVGGVMEIDGVMIEGVRNIIMAQAKSADATGYIVHNFTSGRILFQFGGLPGAAFAMYVTAKPENKKKVASILIPAVFTLALVGISEPLEYTFLFIQPLLYFLVHVPLSGLAYVLAEATNVSINGHALFFMIPNLFQPQKVHALSILYLVPLYFALYFFIFRFAILKWNIKTPGREDSAEGIQLFSKKDFQDRNEVAVEGGRSEPAVTASLPHRIIDALGGADNIESISNCATRLRVGLKDPAKCANDEDWKGNLEAIAVVRVAQGVQVIYGTNVITIASDIKAVLGVD